MIYKIKFLLISVLFIITHCEKSDRNIEKEEGQIISLLIDQMAVAFPLPAPPPKDGSKPEEINIDSIKKVKVKIVVDTTMFGINREIKVPKEYKDFNNIIDDIKGLPENSIKKNFVISKKGHDITFGSSIEDLKIKYSQIVGFSRIAFNDKLKRAALFAYHSTGKLSGYVNFYLLQKKNNKWEIIFKKNVEVS